jgi:2-isopropylmalate synthase
MKTDQLIIFDTTMRDGEQSPGASMTKDEKLRIARQLERMKVDVIEAGFPASSNGDFEAVRAVAGVIRDSVVAGLCRANDKDIQRGIDALKDAKGPWRIHTFLATSPASHEDEAAHDAGPGIRPGDPRGEVREEGLPGRRVLPEDASRSEPDFLCRVIEAVIREGATTINIPDTVGYAVPEQFGEMIKSLRSRIPNSDKAIWSVHCHNDLGMAVANSLAAVRIGGARQIECTVNGLGERAATPRSRRWSWPCAPARISSG